MKSHNALQVKYTRKLWIIYIKHITHFTHSLIQFIHSHSLILSLIHSFIAIKLSICELYVPYTCIYGDLIPIPVTLYGNRGGSGGGGGGGGGACMYVLCLCKCLSEYILWFGLIPCPTVCCGKAAILTLQKQCQYVYCMSANRLICYFYKLCFLPFSLIHTHTHLHSLSSLWYSFIWVYLYWHILLTVRPFLLMSTHLRYACWNACPLAWCE